MYAFVDGLVDKSRIINDILYFESHITDNHRKGEILHRTGSRIEFVPLSLRIGAAREDALEGLLGDFCILFTACSLGELGKCHTSEGVREDVIRLNYRFTLAGYGKIKIIISVVTILF